jgi:hypothetical protein
MMIASPAFHHHHYRKYRQIFFPLLLGTYETASRGKIPLKVL